MISQFISFIRGKSTNAILLFVLVFFIGFRVAFLAINNWTTLTTPYDYESARFAYIHSQYNLEHAEFLGNIDDDVLFSYAGYEYVRGVDPSTINPETPFLLKYVYGISILVFGNPVVVQFLLGLGLLLATGWLALIVTGKWWVSLASILLLSLDGIFSEQLFRTLLDIPHALTIVLSVGCFVLSLRYPGKGSNSEHYLSFRLVENKRKDFSTHDVRSKDNLSILSGLFLGMTAVTKLWISAFLLAATYGMIILFIKWRTQNKKKLLEVSLSSIRGLLPFVIASLAVYVLTHAVFFLYHPNPLDFAQLHIDTVRLYRGYVPEYPWGELLRIIFFGQWRTWWGDKGLIGVEQWWLVWPIAFVGSVLALWRAWVKKDIPVLTIGLFFVLYIVSNLIHLVFPRYLLSVLPLMVVLMVWWIIELIYQLRHPGKDA